MDVLEITTPALIFIIALSFWLGFAFRSLIEPRLPPVQDEDEDEGYPE